MKKGSVPSICVIGGGTGLSVLLRGLKKYKSDLSAVVSVTDDGGSSGALRRELGILPPGDIRNCLVALSEEENLMTKLFQYRFSSHGPLSGHSFGNLFLTAMSDLTGSFDGAIARSSEVLKIRGKVLPVTLYSVNLRAELDDGKVVKGESNIAKITSRVKRLKIYPRVLPTTPEVLETIRNSDVIVLGPGSLYTSIIANLLIEGVIDALRKTRAPKIYVCNIMTQANETKGYKLSDHMEAIFKHIGGDVIDYVLLNNGPIPHRLRKKYAEQASFPVENDLKYVKKLKLVSANLISGTEYARHDPDKLAKAIMKLV
jgi:uncharacterized cofD-like protein